MPRCICHGVRPSEVGGDRASAVGVANVPIPQSPTTRPVSINPGTLVDVNRQIAARRMLYANPNLDLTVDVVNLMNKN